MPNPATAPTTMKTCSACNIHKHTNDFYLTRSLRPNGWCKECERAARRQRYADTGGAADRVWHANNKDSVNDSARRQRVKRKMEALNKYGRSCANCGIVDTEVLSIDHINNDGAAHRRQTGAGSGSAFYAWLKAFEYPAGFQTLCLNCNHKKYLHSLKGGV